MQVLLTVALLTLAAVLLLRREGKVTFATLILTKAFIVLASLSFVSLSFNALAFFDCTKLADGNYYVDNNLGEFKVPALEGVNILCVRRCSMLQR